MSGNFPFKVFARARYRYAAFLFSRTGDLAEVGSHLGVSKERARYLVKEGKNLEAWDEMVRNRPDLWTPCP